MRDRSLSISRRHLLASALLIPAAARAAGRGARFEFKREEVDDPLTERKSFRLTDPTLRFHLPLDHHRAVDRKGDSVLLGGEAEGAPQIFHYDVGRGRFTQLSEGADVNPFSATFDARDRTVFYVQGDRVVEVSGRGGGDRVAYTSPAGRRPSGDLTLTSDGSRLALVEAPVDAPESAGRLVAVDLETKAATVLVDGEAWLSRPQFRPGRTEILYAHEGPWEEVDGRMRLISLGGGEARSLRPREGEEQVGAEHWSADGSMVRFVYHAAPGYRSGEVRQLTPQDGAEAKVAGCSAFGWMRSNLDGSAIVGASRRPSGPNLLVLFTRVGREMTLAEHGTAVKPWERGVHPGPALSDDSQWMFFTSDRDGEPAVYQMKLEDLVSET